MSIFIPTKISNKTLPGTNCEITFTNCFVFSAVFALRIWWPTSWLSILKPFETIHQTSWVPDLVASNVSFFSSHMGRTTVRHRALALRAGRNYGCDLLKAGTCTEAAEQEQIYVDTPAFSIDCGTKKGRHASSQINCLSRLLSGENRVSSQHVLTICQC